MTKIIRLSILIIGLATASQAIASQAIASQAIASQAIASQAIDSNYSLYNKALKRMLTSSYQGWSFTQTTTEEGKVTVERYDDNKDKIQQWQLVSINNSPPTKPQLKKYLKKKRKELKRKKEAGKDEEDGNQFLATLIQPDSLKLIRENPLRSIYYFRPIMDEDGKAMEAHVFGEITIRRDIPMIEQIRIYSTQEFSAYHTTIKQFDQLMQFAPVDPAHPKTSPVFLRSIQGRIKGTAAFFFSFDKTTDIKFSAYRNTPPGEPE